MTVIELGLEELPVRIRSHGFESCVVQAPARSVEYALEHHLARPSSANAAAFTNELLAGCVEPRRSVAEIAALPALDRARLRRAVVAVNDLGDWWRGLHGSYLTPDERLLAVMVWRRERLSNPDVLVEQLAALRQKLVRIGSQQNQALTTGIRSSVAADARRQLATSFPTRSKLLFDYSSGASVLPDFSKSIIGRAFAGQSSGMNAFGVRGKVAGFALSRAAGVAALPTFRSSTSSILGTVAVGKRPWWPNVDKPPGWRVARSAGLERAFAAVAGQRLGFAQYTYGMQGSAAVRSLFPRVVLPSFKLPDFGGHLRDALGKWTELFDEVPAFVRRWQQRALWYLLSGIPLGVTRQLGGLTEVEVEAAVLDALESVMTDGEFVPAIREAVASAPHLGDSQRIHLDHMLEHAAQHEYIHAVAPLYPGLEGAFWEAAYQLPVVTPERRDLQNPNKTVGFETVVKLLPLEQEFQTFMVRAVFGTAGNAYRHGGASSGERRQVLFGIAALAGWLQQFANAPALDVLGSRMSAALPAAIERVREPMPALNAGT